MSGFGNNLRYSGAWQASILDIRSTMFKSRLFQKAPPIWLGSETRLRYRSRSKITRARSSCANCASTQEIFPYFSISIDISLVALENRHSYLQQGNQWEVYRKLDQIQGLFHVKVQFDLWESYNLYIDLDCLRPLLKSWIKKCDEWR